MVAVDASKQLVSDADPMSIKQINFTGCFDKTTNASATNFFESSQRKYSTFCNYYFNIFAVI